MTNTEKFLQLVKENPTLRIVASVESDVVADCDYCRWVGSFGDCYVDEIVAPRDAEKFYYKSDSDINEYLVDMYYDKEPYASMSDEEFDKAIADMVEKLPWEKVICVNIDLPYIDYCDLP